MSETQVLMTVSDFFPNIFGFFSRNNFLEGGFTFHWGGDSFLSGGATPWGFKKNLGMGGGVVAGHPSTMGNPSRC